MPVLILSALLWAADLMNRGAFTPPRRPVPVDISPDPKPPIEEPPQG